MFDWSWKKRSQTENDAMDQVWSTGLQFDTCVLVFCVFPCFVRLRCVVSVNVPGAGCGAVDEWAETGWRGQIHQPDLGLWQENKIKRPRSVGRRNMERTRVTVTQPSRVSPSHTYTCKHPPPAPTLLLSVMTWAGLGKSSYLKMKCSINLSIPP